MAKVIWDDGIVFDDDWLNAEREKNRFCQISSQYDLPLAVQPKERAHSGRSKIKTRAWEELVFEATEESGPLLLPKGRLALQAALFCSSYRGDLSNLLKTIEDALAKRAYSNDNQIDFLNVIRVVREGPERTMVKILERAV